MSKYPVNKNQLSENLEKKTNESALQKLLQKQQQKNVPDEEQLIKGTEIERLSLLDLFLYQ
jgi:hypothetical protein